VSYYGPNVRRYGARAVPPLDTPINVALHAYMQRVYGCMANGYTTRTDLSSFGAFLLMGLIGFSSRPSSTSLLDPALFSLPSR
jgi:hypothetical protein